MPFKIAENKYDGLNVFFGNCRWCCDHKTLLYNRLDIGSLLSSSANDVIESLQYLFVQVSGFSIDIDWQKNIFAKFSIRRQIYQ